MREVAGGEDERHRDHAVRVGADAAEEAEVLDEHPVGEAENDPGDDGDADHCRPTAQEGDPDQPRGRSRGRGSPPSRGRRRRRRSSPPRRRGGAAGASAPSAAPLPVSVPGAGAVVELALPEAAPRPGLQHGHAHEEQTHHRKDRPTEPGARPGPVGQGDEHAGEAVEEDGARGSEGPGEAGGEDAPEALAEDPDDDSPKGAREARLGVTSSRAARRAARRRARPGSIPPRRAP